MDMLLNYCKYRVYNAIKITTHYLRLYRHSPSTKILVTPLCMHRG